jgi:hypothetical protein
LVELVLRHSFEEAINCFEGSFQGEEANFIENPQKGNVKHPEDAPPFRGLQKEIEPLRYNYPFHVEDG